MTAQLAIDLAEKSEVDLFITPSGKIKYKGAQPSVEKLLPLIREHKAEIIQLLTKANGQNIISVEVNLSPCPLCKSHEFINGHNGGYFCTTCQPGHKGALVKAGGQRSNSVLKGNHLGRETPENSYNSSTGSTRGKQSSSFLVAHAWILHHRFELLGFGWKPSELYRRNKSRGIVWLSIWGKPDVEVFLGRKGEIVFHFKNTVGKNIQQTAFSRRHYGSE